MQAWKRILLNGYFRGTRPYRGLRRRAAAAAGRAPVLVVLYHRIVDDNANLWTTSRADFVRALNWLEARFDLVSLEEAQRRIRSQANHRASASITFDDGYAENCDFALPLLVQRRIPCTYFVTSQAVLAGAHFEHDLRMGRRLAPNTLQQVRDMLAEGIEIGVHSRTHADFGRLSDPARLHEELIGSRDELQQALGRPMRYFAFPFGRHANLSSAAFHLARQAGYEAICSAYGGVNLPGDDPFHLQRFGADGAAIRLINWASGDPLQERRVRRFVPGIESHASAPDAESGSCDERLQTSGAEV